MKLISNFLFLTTAFIAISCSSIDDLCVRYPTISSINNTECECPTLLSAIILDSHDEIESDQCIFSMTKDGSIAKCSFTALQYPCDFGQVNIDVTYENDIMTIVEYPSSDLADCRCKMDVSFFIENMPQHDFLLKIYRGNTHGQYDNHYPNCVKKISYSDAQVEFAY